MFLAQDYPLSIPTWEEGEWVEDTVFNEIEDFRNYLKSLFKEPGQYEFDETIMFWAEQSNRFNAQGYYCKYPRMSKDFIDYWDDQKRKSRIGTIYKNNGKQWYLTREYYFWINFLKIYNKSTKKYEFPTIWDIQYHMALYEILAEISYQHAVILKKRQIASSYFHCAKLINQYWFEEGAKLKMGASLKDYVNLKGSWKMLDEYSNFLNEHTAWYRPNNPNKAMDWEQKIQKTVDGRDSTVGLRSTLSGYSFDKDATTGVGGPCRYFFHEEAGIAPKMDGTYEFIRPALHDGMITTGMFIAAGSVGDLDQCEPLKEFMLHPEDNDFYAVESNLLDEEGTIGKHGLFLPEQWSMPPYIDKHGNSLVEEALEAILKQRESWKKTVNPEKYQLRISQKPINVKEAFAYREESKFPLHLITNQTRRIEDKEYPYETINLRRGADNQIIVTESNKQPIKDFPIRKTDVDKEGTIVIWERPVSNHPEHGMYYASIDPVSEGKTTTSESLCSIYVYKNTVQISKQDENGEMKTYLEPGRIVAAWCGRFDDINLTHERLELIIEWYNAWTIVENNISLFIQHMISVRKQKYLVPKDQLLFLKNIGANKAVYQEYGWKNTGVLFKNHMISYAIEFVKEQMDIQYDEETGEVQKIQYGVERIPDIMLMKEMAEYHDGLNVDRLVSFAALVAFVIIQESNRGFKRIIEYGENFDKSQKITKLNRSPFTNIGKTKKQSSNRPRKAFRNIR